MSEDNIKFDNGELRRILMGLRISADGFESLQNEYAKSQRSLRAAQAKIASLENQNRSMQEDMIAAQRERDVAQLLQANERELRVAIAGELASQCVLVAEYSNELDQLMKSFESDLAVGQLSVSDAVLAIGMLAVSLSSKVAAHKASLGIEVNHG